jgi:hypothetical protein
MSPNAIVRADAAFEIGLGVVLVVGAAAGWLDSSDFPTPVVTTVIVLVGLALVGIGAVLVWLARDAVPPELLRSLAIANSTTAVAAIVWCIAADGFSGAGAAIVLATAGALFALAAAQLSTLRAGRALRP